METSSRQQLYGDTLNIFGREEQNFQWSRAYSYLISLSLQDVEAPKADAYLQRKILQRFFEET